MSAVPFLLQPSRNNFSFDIASMPAIISFAPLYVAHSPSTIRLIGLMIILIGATSDFNLQHTPKIVASPDGTASRETKMS